MVQQDEIVIEVEKIKELMDLCSSLFDIRTAFIYAIDDEQYINEIAGNNGDYQDYCMIVQQELKHRCVACDRDKFKEANTKKKRLLYQCYNGLYEMYLPLFIEDHLLGYLHFGQVRSEQDFNAVKAKYSLHEHSQVDELEQSYNRMKIIEKEKLVLISELFQQFADTILRNKLIELKKAKPESFLIRYIDENLHRPVTIHSAARFVGMSPSFVTHKFKEMYGKSFHQYLNHSRIEQAKKLLRKYPIIETAQLCGFNNRYHFSKVFKKTAGITPYEYQVSLKYKHQ